MDGKILEGFRQALLSRRRQLVNIEGNAESSFVEMVASGAGQAELIKPWSSWWFPVHDSYLFRGEGGNLSPLEKYDLYVQKSQNRRVRAADFERDNLYDPAAVGWEGLCHAWALASIVEAEPVQVIQLKDISFGVGDQKALLVKTYEQVEGLRRFGQRYNGNHRSVYDDIYPDQFHKLVQAELFEKGRPFIIDKDPGLAVWNTPVWKAYFKLRWDDLDPHVMHVSGWLTGASPFVDTYDYIGTLPVSFEYTYDLIGNKEPDGSFSVVFGVWTGQSVEFHPDFITPMPEGDFSRSSRNKEIDSKIVAEILRH